MSTQKTIVRPWSDSIAGVDLGCIVVEVDANGEAVCMVSDAPSKKREAIRLRSTLAEQWPGHKFRVARITAWAVGPSTEVTHG